jgi:hypothetical protein
VLLAVDREPEGLSGTVAIAQRVSALRTDQIKPQNWDELWQNE